MPALELEVARPEEFDGAFARLARGPKASWSKPPP